MCDNSAFDIRFIDASEWEEAMALSYRTFLEFDAADFSEEGIKHFRLFISDNNLKRVFEAGFFHVIGAYYKQQLVGVIALKESQHISLLFVDGRFHRIGIGKSLVMAVKEYAGTKLHAKELTVNSSPYAKDFYHKLGFIDTDDEKKQDGVIFTPMKCVI